MPDEHRRQFLYTAAVSASLLPAAVAAPVPKAFRRSRILDVLKELTEVYRTADSRCGDGLHPSATKAEIEAVGEKVGYAIPDEVTQLYLLHNGQDYTAPGVRGLFGRHRLLPLDEIVKYHAMYSEPLGPGQPFRDCPKFPPGPGVEGYWHRRLLPIASWDVYALCVDAHTGAVWEFCPNTGVWLTSRIPSLAVTLSTLVQQVRSGRKRPALYTDADD